MSDEAKDEIAETVKELRDSSTSILQFAGRPYPLFDRAADLLDASSEREASAGVRALEEAADEFEAAAHAGLEPALNRLAAKLLRQRVSKTTNHPPVRAALTGEATTP